MTCRMFEYVSLILGMNKTLGDLKYDHAGYTLLTSFIATLEPQKHFKTVHPLVLGPIGCDLL